MGGGNSKKITDTTKIKKTFENNQKIDRSMVVNSLSKIFNNIANDIIQNNSVAASAAVGASNTIFLSGIKCDTINIIGNKQTSAADLQMQIQSKQSNTSTIASEITTNINKTIEKVGSTDLSKLQADNTKMLNDFMRATPGYDPNKAQKLAGKCGGGGLFSFGNSCKVNTSYELDASVKNALDLDESFKITDNDDITNDISNKINQANFATCQANAGAQNSIIVQDIMCTVNDAAVNADRAAKRGQTFNFEDNEQLAVAKLYMTCVFDQSSINEISQKVYNTIAKRYNQIYDAVAQNAIDKGTKEGEQAGLDYYNDKAGLVDLLAASGAETIMAAAGDLPQATNESKTKTTSESSGPVVDTTLKPSGSKSTIGDLISGLQNKDSNIDNNKIDNNKTEQSKIVKDEIPTTDLYYWFLIGGGIILIILLFVIIIRILSRNKDDDYEENNDDDSE